MDYNRKGVRPDAANGLADWQKKNGSFDPYPVTPVDEVSEYASRKGGGIVHQTDKEEKFAWSIGALSFEAEEDSKVQFVDKKSKPVAIGSAYERIVLPDAMGRDAQGRMLT